MNIISINKSDIRIDKMNIERINFDEEYIIILKYKNEILSHYE